MRVLVTGAASGIGRATARLLASGVDGQGSPSLLLADRDEAGLAALADELRARGCEAATCTADLALPDAAAKLADAAGAALGGLDALVSNAGALHRIALEAVDAAEFDRIFAVNARATFLLACAVLPMLKQSRGAIVATASISGLHPTPSLGVYGASKAALIMLVEQMALEWGPFGIRANCVSPGPTHTAMTASAYDDAERKARRGADIPLQRVATPEDIAGAIAFLIGPASGFVTGVNLVVDGGIGRTAMVSRDGAASSLGGR